MLSDDDLKKAYWKARSEIGGDAVGLRAVAEAAVKDAVGGDEPVAWMYTDRFGTHFTDEKDEWEIAEGIESVQPLYARPQASAAVPDAVMAERHRIYAALEADPSALWRDQGFQGWRRKRGENTDS